MSTTLSELRTQLKETQRKATTLHHIIVQLETLDGPLPKRNGQVTRKMAPQARQWAGMTAAERSAEGMRRRQVAVAKRAAIAAATTEGAVL